MYWWAKRNSLFHFSFFFSKVWRANERWKKSWNGHQPKQFYQIDSGSHLLCQRREEEHRRERAHHACSTIWLAQRSWNPAEFLRSFLSGLLFVCLFVFFFKKKFNSVSSHSSDLLTSIITFLFSHFHIIVCIKGGVIGGTKSAYDESAFASAPAISSCKKFVIVVLCTTFSFLFIWFVVLYFILYLYLYLIFICIFYAILILTFFDSPLLPPTSSLFTALTLLVQQWLGRSLSICWLLRVRAATTTTTAPKNKKRQKTTKKTTSK